MEDFEQANSDLDSGLIDEIVCKVKSEGLFDQFRRECLADIDTKPAYQNLHHRVEQSVSSFLDEQRWNPQMNKNQVREKLRKLITEKRFFETGIESIVDQVVNPKLTTNFGPKIDDVAYKFMGIEKPSLNMNLKLNIDTEMPLPVYDLEQVSPESEKSHESKYAARLATNSDDYHMHEDFDGKNEDLESPAFEPIEATTEHKVKSEPMEMDDDDMDISDGDDAPTNGFGTSHNDEVKSNLSSISGLTSNDSNNSCEVNRDGDGENKIETLDANNKEADAVSPETHENTTEMPESRIAPEITIDSAEKLPLSENIISNTNDFLIDNMNQDSILSQVSSTSRLSIVTNNNTATQMGDGENDGSQPGDGDCKSQPAPCPYGISEEAQMQKFNDSSSSSNNLIIDTDNMCANTSQLGKKDLITSFSLREEIKFEGTERKFYDLNVNHENDNKQSTEHVSNTIDEFDTNGKECNRESADSIGKVMSLDKQHTDFDENGAMTFKYLSTNTKSNNDNSIDNDANEQPSSSRSANNTKSNRNVDHKQQHSEKDKNQQKSRSSIDSHGKDIRKSSMDDSCSRDSSKKWKDKSESSVSSSPSRRKHSSSSGHSRKESEKPSSSHSNSKKSSRHSEKHKVRSDSQRSSSNKDDHSAHKDKSTPRQRSRSKDSNDGFTLPNVQRPFNQSNVVEQSSTNNESGTTHSSNKTEKIAQTVAHSSSGGGGDDFDSSMDLSSVSSSDEFQSGKTFPDHKKIVPVVIDQILTGNELDLKTFIGENRDDPVVSSIEQSLGVDIKKPKVAANIFEAKKLMKIRKQIELSNQKKIEKATVLAKQYIRTKALNMRDDTQGIELEFVCVENEKDKGVSGPKISSPVTHINGKTIDQTNLNLLAAAATTPSSTSSSTRSKAEKTSSSAKRTKFDDKIEADKMNFIGFETCEMETADACYQNFLNSVGSDFKEISSEIRSHSRGVKAINSNHQDLPDRLHSDTHCNFANEPTSNAEKIDLTKTHNGKRKIDADSRTRDSIKSASNEDDEMILANVFISKSSTECNIKTDESTRTDNQISNRNSLEKQRQKTRYTNEDLFKPRPLLSGGSRRRRGVNCNE